MCACFIMIHKIDCVRYFGSDTSSCHEWCFHAVLEGKGKGSTLTHSSVASSILRWLRACEWNYIFLFFFPVGAYSW